MNARGGGGGGGDYDLGVNITYSFKTTEYNEISEVC